MRFGINLGGGNLPEESREDALAGRLEKARLAKRYGYHSLWTGAGYLNNDFHAMLLLARVAAEAPGLELGMVACCRFITRWRRRSKYPLWMSSAAESSSWPRRWDGGISNSMPSACPKRNASPASARCRRS